MRLVANVSGYDWSVEMIRLPIVEQHQGDSIAYILRYPVSLSLRVDDGGTSWIEESSWHCGNSATDALTPIESVLASESTSRPHFI